MDFTKISIRQVKGLATIIAKDIANKRNAGYEYNIEEMMLEIYNIMIENGQDEDKAITLAALVPKAVIAQVGQYAPNGAYLAPILPRVGELITECEDYAKVKKLLLALSDETQTSQSIECAIKAVPNSVKDIAQIFQNETVKDPFADDVC